MPSADSKSWRPPIPEFPKNRTPCVGTTGRHRSEQVDGIHRNRWSAWPGLCINHPRQLQEPVDPLRAHVQVLHHRFLFQQAPPCVARPVVLSHLSQPRIGIRQRLHPLAPTQMPTAGWPIAGWLSSGRYDRTARRTMSRTTYSNVLSVGDLDPRSMEAHVNPR